MSEADSGATARWSVVEGHGFGRLKTRIVLAEFPETTVARTHAGMFSEADNVKHAALIVEAVNSYDAAQARIQALEAELAGCRACRAKVDCISRGEPSAVIPQGDETNEALQRLTHGVEYRRKDYGHGWILMAAFDGELAAARYFEKQGSGNDEDWPWVYRMVDLPRKDAP